MNKNIIECVHFNVNSFSGVLYLILNNRLLALDLSTPSFNDYNEWRISDMSYAHEEYDLLKNEVEKLTKLEYFEPIQLTEKEAEYLNIFATSSFEDETFETLAKEFKLKYPDAIDFMDYAGEPLLASVFYKGNDFLEHSICKNTGYDELGIPDFASDYQVTTDKWVNKKDITVNQGIYNILIPIMDAYTKAALKKSK